MHPSQNTLCSRAPFSLIPKSGAHNTRLTHPIIFSLHGLLSVAHRKAGHSKANAPIPGYLVYRGPYMLHTKRTGLTKPAAHIPAYLVFSGHFHLHTKMQGIPEGPGYLLFRVLFQLHTKRQRIPNQIHISQGIKCSGDLFSYIQKGGAYKNRCTYPRIFTVHMPLFSCI